MSGASRSSDGRHCLPHGEHVDGGAAGGVIVAGNGGDGEGARALEPVVDVHGQRQFLLAGGGDGVDVAGDGPGGEGLVGVVAEDLGPGAGLLAEGLEQVGGDGRVEDLLRERREVADQAERAGFVFDLHHQDGVLRVGLLQMAHERGKGGAVGVEVGGRVGAEDVDGHAGAGEHARVGRGVGLHPVGHVVHLAVLPRAEPEQDEADFMCPRLLQYRVDHSEVEGAAFRFELLPVDGDFEGVEAERFGGGPVRHRGAGASRRSCRPARRG